VLKVAVPVRVLLVEELREAQAVEALLAEGAPEAAELALAPGEAEAPLLAPLLPVPPELGLGAAEAGGMREAAEEPVALLLPLPAALPAALLLLLLMAEAAALALELTEPARPAPARPATLEPEGAREAALEGEAVPAVLAEALPCPAAALAEA
jgi:hypothetical protein